MSPAGLAAASLRAQNAIKHLTAGRKEAAIEDALDGFRLFGEAIGLQPLALKLVLDAAKMAAVCDEPASDEGMFRDWSSLYEATGRQVLQQIGLDPSAFNLTTVPTSAMPKTDDYEAAKRDGRVTEEARPYVVGYGNGPGWHKRFATFELAAAFYLERKGYALRNEERACDEDNFAGLTDEQREAIGL